MYISKATFKCGEKGRDLGKMTKQIFFSILIVLNG